MAPTTAGCCPMLQTQSVEEVGSGRRRLSLDSWVCLPILRPVRTVASNASSSVSSVSSTGSSCATQTQTQTQQQQKATQDLAPVKTLDVEDEVRESGCETPKSKEHRIPDVDVGFCPPAPRKPRAMARRRRVQPTSFFNTPDFENFLSQHKVQVGS